MSPVTMLTIAFIAALALTGLWLWLARSRAWLDRPNFRSSHEIPIPLSGGVGIVVPFVVLALWPQRPAPDAQGYWMLAAAAGLATTGLIDDFCRLGIRLRLFLQLLAVASLWPLLVALPPLVLPFALVLHGAVLAALLSVAVLWLVNLYNFMDGIDALAATEGIFVCTALALLTMLAGHPNPDTSLLYLGGTLAGFLFFNLPPARIFLGDVGSYFLGFMISVIGFQLIAEGKLGYWTLPILLGTFVADASTTLLGRVLAGAVWYHGHRSHAYQLLAARWQSHGLVVVANLVINVVWLFPMAWLSELRPGYGLWITLLAWLPLAVGAGLVRKAHDVSS